MTEQQQPFDPSMFKTLEEMKAAGFVEEAENFEESVDFQGKTGFVRKGMSLEASLSEVAENENLKEVSTEYFYFREDQRGDAERKILSETLNNAVERCNGGEMTGEIFDGLVAQYESLFSRAAIFSPVYDAIVLNPKDSAEDKPRSVYFSRNFLVLLCYSELAKKGMSLSEETEQRYQPIVQSYIDYRQWQTRVAKGEKEQSAEITHSGENLAEQLAKMRKAMDILFPLLQKLQYAKPEDFDNLKQQLIEDSSGSQNGAELLSSAGPSTWSHASFSYFYQPFTSAELLCLLSDESMLELSNIQTVPDALKFIESQPLNGKRIAEIGGNQTSMLIALGAEVENASSGEAASKGLGDNIVTLDNWKNFFREGYYDLTCSHMVLDAGSGIEYMRPNVYNELSYDKKKNKVTPATEFYSIMSQMTKDKGVSLHVGLRFLLSGGLPTPAQSEQEQRHQNIFMDGKSTLARAIDEDGHRITQSYDTTLGGSGYNNSDILFEKFDYTFGFRIKNILTQQDNRELGIAGDLVALEKQHPPTIQTFSDIENYRNSNQFHQG